MARTLASSKEKEKGIGGVGVDGGGGQNFTNSQGLENSAK